MICFDFKKNDLSSAKRLRYLFLPMKKILLLSILTTLFIAVGASRTLAYTYGHDDKGWYDEHSKHHKFIVHNHHHGYWDTDKGVRVFVIMD
jgi:hypothetical protein